MKKVLLIPIGFFLGISLLFNNCDKDKSVEVLPLMSAKVDNEDWSSVFTNAVMYMQEDYISIVGTPGSAENADKSIQILVNKRQEGTYVFEVSNIDECMIYYTKTAGATYGSSDFYQALMATVTISKIDTEKKTVSGTFSGTLYEDATSGYINITDGKFENMPYQEAE
jgi:hypothetical protein